MILSPPAFLFNNKASVSLLNTTGFQNTGTDGSVSHTIDSECDVLIVAVMYHDNNKDADYNDFRLKYGTKWMQKVNVADAAANGATTLVFYLENPASGAQTLYWYSQSAIRAFRATIFDIGGGDTFQGIDSIDPSVGTSVTGLSVSPAPSDSDGILVSMLSIEGNVAASVSTNYATSIEKGTYTGSLGTVTYDIGWSPGATGGVTFSASWTGSHDASMMGFRIRVASDDLTLIPAATGTVINENMNGGGGAGNAFDGVYDQVAACAQTNYDSAGYEPVGVGKDWGSGNTKTVKGFKCWGRDGFNYGFKYLWSWNPRVILKLWGSDSSTLASATELASHELQNSQNGHIAIRADVIGAYRYHWATIQDVDGAGDQHKYFAEVELYE